MKETTPNAPQNPNLLRRSRKSLAALAGSLTLSSCVTIGHPSLEYSPKDRFAYDYTTYAQDDARHAENCLSNSPYDVDSGNQGRASVTPPTAFYDSSTDILTVTPVNGKNPLRMTGFKQVAVRVNGADAEANSILASYGCDPKTPYAE